MKTPICPICENELQQSKKDPSVGMCATCRKVYKWQTDANGYALERYKETKINKFLLISLILGAAYLIYSVVYWSGTAGSGDNIGEQIGTGIATALVMPHLICTVVAVVFNALGLFLNKRGFALTGAILYTVAIVLFPMYFMFVIIQMILSYVGFAKLPKA